MLVPIVFFRLFTPPKYLPGVLLSFVRALPPLRQLGLTHDFSGNLGSYCRIFVA